MVTILETIADKALAIVRKAGETQKGVNVRLSWERDCKVKKACSDIIRKRTETVGRVGIDYSNQKAVIEAREAGELPAVEQPIWYGAGEWVTFPYVIRHVKTGQLYLRLYRGTSLTFRPSVQYTRNGQPVTFEEIESDLLASEKAEKNGLCFCVKLEDMLSIGEHEETFEVEVK